MVWQGREVVGGSEITAGLCQTCFTPDRDSRTGQVEGPCKLQVLSPPSPGGVPPWNHWVLPTESTMRRLAAC